MNAWRQTVPSTGQFIRGSADMFFERMRAFISSPHEIVRSVGASALHLAVFKARGGLPARSFSVIRAYVTSPDLYRPRRCALRRRADPGHERRAEARCVRSDCASPLLRHCGCPRRLDRRVRRAAGVARGAARARSRLVRFVFDGASAGSDISVMSGLLRILGHHAMVELASKITQRPRGTRSTRSSRTSGSVGGCAGHRDRAGGAGRDDG
jgi:hypothetical protein